MIGDYFYGWVHLRQGWDFIITESGREGEIQPKKERINIKSEELAKLHSMTESEFKEFVLNNGTWQNANCEKCVWGPYEEIYVVIKSDKSEGIYEACRLAPIMIDVD